MKIIKLISPVLTLSLLVPAVVSANTTTYEFTTIENKIEWIKASDQFTQEQKDELLRNIEKTKKIKENWGKKSKIDIEKIERERKNRFKGINSSEIKSFSISEYNTSKGDILYTPDANVKGWAYVGHAAIVYSSLYTVEAWSDGVKRMPNDWPDKWDNMAAMWVSGAEGTDYSYAGNYAYSQIGKPYNWNFFDYERVDKFYCSQLVWRAWYNRGWDLNDGSAVFPSDIYEDNDTIVFYEQ